MKDVLRFCEQESDWLLQSIETLVALESPSVDKSAVDRCGEELARLLMANGARVDRLPRTSVGDPLLAEFGCGDTQVLLLGHFDTVWPVGQLARMPLRRDDGKLYGPGTFDMKAGIGVGLLAVRALYELGDPPGCRVTMLLTTDEEVGSAASRAAIEDEARRSRAVLVLEPALPGGAVKTSRKGCGEFELVVQGIAAHAGIDPGKGASAIHELAHQVVSLETLRDTARGVSVNVGLISGGSRPNVVAERATATIDVRVPTIADGARVEEAIRRLRPVLHGTSLELRGGFDRPPLERSAAVIELYNIARNVARDLGDDLQEGGTGGGSDGNFTAALGVPTLDGLGPVGDGAHALHEHVEMASLPRRAALVAGLIARLSRE